MRNVTKISSVLALSLLTACDSKSEDESLAPEATADGTSTEEVDAEEGEISCADEGLCYLTGTYTEDLVLTADVDWVLRGGVFIGDDVNPATLTIEAGTTIYGESATDGMLVIRRNAQIIAEGTADAPITMTSSKAEGSRARGDWGGLIINGNAPINACADSEETICEAYGEGGTGWYGGNDAADSSGVLNYVVVAYAGTLVSPDNELNGIAFQGVGSGTEVDFIQVHMNADDGVEFFGGSVSAKHVLITGAGDDSLDWTDGWNGNAQFVVIQQFDDNGDNGIEADNNGEANDADPMSEPTLANFTIIGSPDSEKSDLGILLREGTGAHIVNSMVLGFNDACLDIDHEVTWSNVDDGGLTLEGVALDCDTNFKDDSDDEGEPASDIEAFFTAGSGNGTTNVGVVDGFNLEAPDYRANSGVAAAITSEHLTNWFDTVDFIGAVSTDDDWTAGWTVHSKN